MQGYTDGSVPLVGRHTEVATLERVARATGTAGRLALVEGEAGIGKSRLMEATVAAARRSGVTVLSARAEELESRRPFATILDCPGLERLAGHPDGEHPDHTVGGTGRFRVAELLLERLDELSARGPVLLAVEDLHWADEDTAGVLARVAAEIDRLPVALVASTRPVPRGPGLAHLLRRFADQGATTVVLGPLDEPSSRELAARLVGAPLGTGLARQVARAGGNPLFVCELVGALRAADAIVCREGAAEIVTSAEAVSLPVTILHRLSFVPAETLALLGLASVLGARFSAADLALLAGRPLSALVPTLQSARRAGVIAGDGEHLAFRHELIRDALYRDLPLSVRRGLHREVADALAGAGGSTERIAEHLVRAAAPGDRAGTAAIVAAGRALLGRAPTLSVDLYRRAIDLAPEPAAAREDLLPELAQALVAAGLFDDGERACREALEHEADPDVAGRLHLALMFLMLRQARLTDAITQGEQGLAGHHLGERDRQRTRSVIAMARAFSGACGSAVDDARAVLEASHDDLARALATNALTVAAADRGAFTRAAELIAPIVQWADHEGSTAAYDVRPHMLCGLVLIRLDSFDRAQATIERGRRAAEDLGNVDAVPVFHYQQALLDYARGRLDDALAELETRARLTEQLGIGWQLTADGLCALIELHRDDLLAAERHATAAERAAAAGASLHGAGLMVLARARLLEARGSPAAALETVADFLDTMLAAGTATVLPSLGPELARLAVRTGQVRRLTEIVSELRRIADLNPAVRSLRAQLLQTQGLLDRDGDALLAGFDLLRESGRSLEAAAAAEDAAALGVRCRELLGYARETYALCGAPRDLARVEAALRARGVRRGVRGARRRPATGWEALTPTELKVVRLVCERLTNQEIAQRMFVSRRTVQTHVSHALAKLGAGNRRELATEAARLAGWELRVEGAAVRAGQPRPADLHHDGGCFGSEPVPH